MFFVGCFDQIQCGASKFDVCWFLNPSNFTYKYAALISINDSYLSYYVNQLS